MPVEKDATSEEKCTSSVGSPEEIVVTLGELQISASRFHAKAIRKRPASDSQLSEDEKRAVLDEMIDDLVLSKMARDAGLLSHSSTESKLIQVLIQRKILSEVDSLRYTEDELRAWYEANRDEMVDPSQVHMAVITIRSSAKRSDMAALERTQRIYDQLQEKPALFADLAAMHSEDVWSRRRGVVGWIPRTGKPGIEPHVLEAAFVQEVGSFSEPIQTSNGWTIVHTMAIREAREKAWERSKGDVMRAMKEEKITAARNALVERLRATAEIETLVDLDSMELFGPLESMPEEIVARVNAEPILHVELATQASRSFPQGTTELSIDDRQQVLQEVVERELLLQEALRLRLDQDVSVERKLKELAQQEILTESGALEVTEDELFDYFRDHPEAYTKAPRVQLRRIVLEINASRSETEAMTLIESIRQQSMEDSSLFTALAKEHSEGPYASKGGSMGWVSQRPRPGLSSDDQELIFELEAGEISEPQLRNKELVIFQIVQRTEGHAQRFEDVRTSIEHQIIRDRKVALLERARLDARAESPVVVHEETLASQVVVYCAPPQVTGPGGGLPSIPTR
jgi:parvulin-like peptidyl-prolyl isomerase